MPDERTASQLTAMSTAKRNNFGPENLVRLANSINIGELPISNLKPSDPVVTGIPTLQDLLNADSVDNQVIDENALFNHPDPYGISDLEAMDGEDETDTAPSPVVIRRGNLPTLDIESYIDLKAPKLMQRFASEQGRKPEQTTSQPATKPAKESSTPWIAADAEWDAADW
ncbi:hypothetical protein K438DRAFT_1779665 [Mycena galopus ATCC 62051]|nr:hypothetical protein K438DRAFT_1779665 [Mycena galopus ATCC 62051]